MPITPAPRRQRPAPMPPKAFACALRQHLPGFAKSRIAFGNARRYCFLFAFLF